MTKPIKSAAPEGMSAVSPHLVCAGAANAMDFYKQAFGAEEMSRLPAPDGSLLHGCMRNCGASIMLVDEMPACGGLGPKTLKGTPVTIHLYVDDTDAVIAQAVGAGATIVMPAEDMFWGDRYGVIEDPFGHRWSVATHQRDVTPAEIQDAVAKFVPQG